MTVSRFQWLILGLLFASTAINYIDRQALSILLPTLREELSLSSSNYGAITTLFLVSYTISQCLSGMLVDRIGAKRGLAISVAVWSVAAMFHATARGPVTLGIFRVILGLGEAGSWPAGGKAVSQWFPPDKRAFAMGVFDGGSAIGAIIAPPLVALLGIHFSWRTAFVVTGFIGLIWLAAWLWIYDSPARHENQRTRNATVVFGDKGVSSKSGPNFATTFKEIIKMRALWGLMATRFMATPVWWFYVFWLPDYLAKDRGFTLAQLGLFAWIPYLTADIGKIAGGAFSDGLIASGKSLTFARKGVMLCGAVAMAGGTQVVGVEAPAMAIAWACLATFGFGMWSSNILALHADIFSSEKMGRALGFTGMAASIGGAITTYVAGQLVDSAGYSPVFFGAGVMALFACLALFFGVGKVHSRVVV